MTLLEIPSFAGMDSDPRDLPDRLHDKIVAARPHAERERRLPSELLNVLRDNEHSG